MFDVRRALAVLVRRRVPDAIDDAAAPIDAGRPEEGLAALEAALRDGRLSSARRAFAHNKRGVALVALGRREEAFAAFQEALLAADVFAPALVNLGNLLLEDGDLADAIAYYRAAIRADEAYPGAYRNLGVALRRAGRASEAARFLRKALQLEMRRRS